MGRDEPIEGARRANEWWSYVPFAELRLAVQEEPDFEAGMERMERAGYGSVADLIAPGIDLDLSGFQGGNALPSGRGREAWFAFWRDWTEPWESLTIEHGNYEARGDKAIVDLRVTGRGAGSGAEVGLDMTQVWTIEDGRVVGYAVFDRRDDALAALESEVGTEP